MRSLISPCITTVLSSVVYCNYLSHHCFNVSWCIAPLVVVAFSFLITILLPSFSHSHQVLCNLSNLSSSCWSCLPSLLATPVVVDPTSVNLVSWNMSSNPWLWLILSYSSLQSLPCCPPLCFHLPNFCFIIFLSPLLVWSFHIHFVSKYFFYSKMILTQSLPLSSHSPKSPSTILSIPPIVSSSMLHLDLVTLHVSVIARKPAIYLTLLPAQYSRWYLPVHRLQSLELPIYIWKLPFTVPSIAS